MPLFRRRPPEFAAPIGTLPCADSSCLNQTAITCAYRDRRGAVCAVAFCPEHWSMVGGIVYCRRHAGTITALGERADSGGLPDLNNRGPSLVSWIAADLSTSVEALLSGYARGNERVKADSEVTVIFDQNRRRGWERCWKLVESTGVNLKIGVRVAEEGDDALVDARVNSSVVARGVPPWITRRRQGQTVTPQVDIEQRDLFRRFLMGHIAAAVDQLRAGGMAGEQPIRR